MRPPATCRPARTAPRSPRALVPVDAATQAPGPGLSPRAALPASRRSHAPQGAPDRHADTLARAPPAAWPARRALPWHALRPHSVGLLGPLPTAGWAARTSRRPPRAPHPHGAASASAARRYPCARPRPQPPGNATCSPQVPRPAEGPAPGTPTPLRTRPPQLGLQDAPSPGTPTDPTVWGAQGHCRPPAGPPAAPRDRHGPRTRTAPRPTRPPAATHAPGPGLDPPPAVPRGLPLAGHRDRHQGTAPEMNTTRQQLYTHDRALVLPRLCPPSPMTDARARPHYRGRGGHTTAPAQVTRRRQTATPRPPLAPVEG